jgi:hypothetical protein
VVKEVMAYCELLFLETKKVKRVGTSPSIAIHAMEPEETLTLWI